MNQLSTERREQVIGCLVEGMSIRGTVRVTGVAKNTVTKLLVELGQACAEYQDDALTDLSTKRVECDEIWAFCHSKQKNVPEEHEGEFGYGDVWTWVAIDADTKLVPSWLVGERTTIDAYTFLSDLKSRLRGRVQMTTDGHKLYLTVVEPLFGADGVDFAMLHKLYGRDPDGERTYSPAVCTGIDKRIICGEPDEQLISTSYVERQNLTMRMGMRRFTRLTNAFSKKVENLAHAVSLHFMHYNFCRVHQSLTITQPDGKRVKRTPAMAAGVADHPWSVFELVACSTRPSQTDPLPAGGIHRERAILAARVGELRCARQWTRQQLGARSQVHPDTIDRIEKGTKDPALSTLVKLVKIFELSSIDQLFGDLPIKRVL